MPSSTETPARATKPNKRSRPGGNSTPRSSKRANINGGKTSDQRKSANTADSTNTTGGKANKGLRHFSKHVCNKLEEKQKTSYNEVADELVAEFLAQRALEEDSTGNGASNETPGTGVTTKKKRGAAGHDEKNIRRRVYDALNVLDALDIISKEKKEIRWIGLPSRTSSDLKRLRNQRNVRISEVEKKRELLRDLIVQSVCFRNLIKRNTEREQEQERNMGMSLMRESQKDDKIHLPFVVVNTSSRAVIQVEFNDDQTDVRFDFSMPFEIKDDDAILKLMGFDKTTEKELSKMLPTSLLNYCQDHNLLDSIIATPLEVHSSSSSYQDNVLPDQDYHQHHQEQRQLTPPYQMHNHHRQSSAHGIPEQHSRHSHAYAGGAPHLPPSQPPQHSFAGYSGSGAPPSPFHPPSSY